MNKKAFTLIELLGVLTLLAIIALIAVTSVTRIIETSKNNISESQKKLIISAAKNYVANDPFNAPSCVNVTTLKDQGYIDDGSLSGSVTINENKYTYSSSSCN